MTTDRDTTTCEPPRPFANTYLGHVGEKEGDSDLQEDGSTGDELVSTVLTR